MGFEKKKALKRELDHEELRRFAREGGISLAPLSFEEAIGGLLATKPLKKKRRKSKGKK